MNRTHMLEASILAAMVCLLVVAVAGCATSIAPIASGYRLVPAQGEVIGQVEVRYAEGASEAAARRTLAKWADKLGGRLGPVTVERIQPAPSRFVDQPWPEWRASASVLR